MSIDYDALMATSLNDDPCSYCVDDCILYALGVGFGSDPTDRDELPYVYEGGMLSTVPTMATALSSADFTADWDWDYRQVLLVEERLDLYRALPPEGTFLANRRVAAVHDMGAGKGARVVVESEVRRAEDDTVIFTSGQTLIARADGGFGGPSGEGPERHRLPGREPDLTANVATRPDQALLFRLTGDMNPLHADPAVARGAGFDRPILHGRCTYGIACRSILQTICDYDFTLIRGFNARFTSPVYPGDTITTEMWQDRNIVSFRCKVLARNAIVIDNGRCTLAA